MLKVDLDSISRAIKVLIILVFLIILWREPGAFLSELQVERYWASGLSFFMCFCRSLGVPSILPISTLVCIEKNYTRLVERSCLIIFGTHSIA